MRSFQQPPILCKEQPLDENSIFCLPQNMTSGVGINYGEELNSEIRVMNTKPDDCQLPLNNNKILDFTNSGNEKPKRGAFSGMIQILHIRGFVNKLMARRKLLNKLKKYHYDIIRDVASSFNITLLKKNAFKLKPLISEVQVERTLRNRIEQLGFYKRFVEISHSCLTALSTIYLSIPLVGPESQIKVFWDCLMALARIYFIVLIPLDLAWDQQNYMYGYLKIPTIMAIAMLIIEFIFSLFQSYYDDGQIVTSRKQIAQHLVSKAYGLELISTLILILFFIFSEFQEVDLNIFNNWYYIFTLVSFVQYNNIAQLRQKLEDALNLSKSASSIVQLIKLFFLLFYVIHLFACAWYWAGNYSNRYLGFSWMERRDILDAGFGIQYLNAFYYSTVTMFTVGYGDITPMSTPELICSIINMMVCSVQLSYSVSTVGAIIDKISSDKEEQQRKFHIINTYMKKKGLTYDLQVKVREYLNYYWSDQNIQVTEQENEILSQLSSRLREQVICQANLRLIESISLFKDQFSNQFKQSLIKQIQQICLPPENILDLAKSTNDPLAVCYVESGMVKVVIENDGERKFSSTLSTVQTGECFGLLTFINGNQAQERYITTRFTKLLVLSRSAFMETVKQFPLDYETFFKIQDDLQNNTLYKYFPIRCTSCDSMHHKAINCPLLQYIPDKEKLVKSAQLSIDQDRKKTKRSMRANNRKFTAAINQDFISSTAQQIQDEYPQLSLLYDQEFHKAQIEKNSNLNPTKIILSVASPKIAEMSSPPGQSAPAKQDLMKKSSHRHSHSKRSHSHKRSKHEKKKNVKNDAKSKFRRIVKIVIDRLRKQKEMTWGKMMDILQFNQLEYLQRKREIFHQYLEYQDELQDLNLQKIIDEIDYTELKIRNNGIGDAFSCVELDCMKPMSKFHPEHNSEIVVGQQFKIRALQEEQRSRLRRIRGKLTKYMIFPQFFIEKYHQILNVKELVPENKDSLQNLRRNRRASKGALSLLGNKVIKRK